MEDSGKFNLTHSFDVDNGELDDIPKELCFVLGVEWEMIRQLIEKKIPFEHVFHSENIQRVEKLCAGLSYNIIPHDDWPTLIVC